VAIIRGVSKSGYGMDVWGVCRGLLVSKRVRGERVLLVERVRILDEMVLEAVEAEALA
jgi:hypothetical protein